MIIGIEDTSIDGVIGRAAARAPEVLPNKLRVGGWDVCASIGDDDFKFVKMDCTA